MRRHLVAASILIALVAGSVDLTWTASTDDVGVTGYEIGRNGAVLAAVGPATSYSDGSVAPSTTYSYVVRALDAAGHRSDPSNTATLTTPPAPTTQTLTPDADAQVREAFPSTAYGATSSLRIDGGTDPDVQSLLRFSVSGASAGVTKATL